MQITNYNLWRYKIKRTETKVIVYWYQNEGWEGIQKLDALQKKGRGILCKYFEKLLYVFCSCTVFLY